VNYSSDRDGAERPAPPWWRRHPSAASDATDIVPLAVFLASDESAWITGEIVRAAGGVVVAG
jgi:NAD(P)-dependent dehydrogenase (short-subunit alcohol dehydrogenase family)